MFLLIKGKYLGKGKVNIIVKIINFIMKSYELLNDLKYWDIKYMFIDVWNLILYVVCFLFVEGFWVILYV